MKGRSYTGRTLTLSKNLISWFYQGPFFKSCKSLFMSSIGKIIPVSTVLEKNCTHCNKVFTTMQGLNTHIGKMHTAQDHKKFSICSVPDPWTHTCPRSGYLFDLLIVCLHNISQLMSADSHPCPCMLTDSVEYRTLS